MAVLNVSYHYNVIEVKFTELNDMKRMTRTSRIYVRWYIHVQERYLYNAAGVFKI